MVKKRVLSGPVNALDAEKSLLSEFKSLFTFPLLLVLIC